MLHTHTQEKAITYANKHFTNNEKWNLLLRNKKKKRVHICVCFYHLSVRFRVCVCAFVCVCVCVYSGHTCINEPSWCALAELFRFVRQSDLHDPGNVSGRRLHPDGMRRDQLQEERGDPESVHRHTHEKHTYILSYDGILLNYVVLKHLCIKNNVFPGAPLLSLF